MKKTLITGASGGLGGAVATFLKEKSGADNISVLVRNGECDKAKEYRERGFEVRVGDYGKYTSLAKAFEGIEVLYFVSGNDIEGRTRQHENVVKAAKAREVKHVLYTSMVRGDESPKAPLYPVISGHIKTEEWIRDAGFAYTFLRHNLYGEVIPLFSGEKERLSRSRTIYLPARGGRAAFVPREELARAGAAILTETEAHENKTYELNGSETLTFNQIAELISAIIKEKVVYVSPEPKEFEKALIAQRVPESLIEVASMFGQAIAKGEFDRQNDDLELILGRKPQSITDFLQKIYS